MKALRFKKIIISTNLAQFSPTLKRYLAGKSNLHLNKTVTIFYEDISGDYFEFKLI